MGHSRSARSRFHSPLITQLPRWIRPPRTLRPTRAGWVFIVLTLLVGFRAMQLGNNQLYMIMAAMLAFLILSGLLSEAVLRHLKVLRHPPLEAFARCASPLAVEVSNTHPLVPAYTLVVEDFARMHSEPGRVFPVSRIFVLHLGPKQAKTKTYSLVAPARGELEFLGFRISTRFPFGLFSKSLFLEAPEGILVYPAIEPTRFQEISVEDPGTEETKRTIRRRIAAQATGLREFAKGDGFRRIHWPASLRTQHLLVRAGESSHADAIEVRLKTRGVDPGRFFERQVSHATSEVVYHLGEDVPVGLRTDSTHLPPRRTTRGELLRFLASVQPDETAERSAL